MNAPAPSPSFTPKKLTPVVPVDAIEPLLPFWRDRIGFEVTAEVPHEDRLGFVILARGGAELMLQTHESIQADDPRMGEVIRPGTSVLFFEVDSLAGVEEALEAGAAGAEVLIPRRATFYGSQEVWVRAPDGTVAGFAEFGEGVESD
jgi:catechol 2,3-dioxygenase-like lactoylglutathione lyase family enzyme